MKGLEKKLQAKAKEVQKCESLIDEQHKMMLNGSEKLELMTRKFFEASRKNNDQVFQLEERLHKKDEEIKTLKLLLLAKRNFPSTKMIDQITKNNYQLKELENSHDRSDSIINKVSFIA